MNRRSSAPVWATDIFCMVSSVASNFDLMLENREISPKMLNVPLPLKNDKIPKSWPLILPRHQTAELRRGGSP